MGRATLFRFLALGNDSYLALPAGLARLISSRFSPIELAMTLVVGIAAILGIAYAAVLKTVVRPSVAAALVFAMLTLSLVALKVSMLPGIAQD